MLVVGAALLGAAVVGPLINHAVVRWIGWRVVLPPYLGWVPANRDIGRVRARCAGCGRALAPAGLAALPSTVVAGRCRGCGHRLAPWYAAAEWVTGLVFGLCAAAVGWSVALVPVLCLAAGLVAMSVVDLAVMRIPTRFVYATAAALAGGLVLVAVVEGPGRRLAGAAVGAAAYGAFLLVLHLLSPRALGFGDVRLATVVGAAAGWAAWRADHPLLTPVQGVVNAALLAGLAGSAVGLVLVVVRGRNHPFPFGPAVAAGGLVVVLAAL